MLASETTATTFAGPRPRRLRRSPALRRMTRETALHPSDFIYPLFVTAEQGTAHPIASLPGHSQWSVDRLDAEVDAILELGVPAVLLFGVLPAEAKDESGSAGWDPHGPVPRAIAALKRRRPELVVVADVCLCEYTSHGHCGVVIQTTDGGYDVDNDPSLELLARTGASLARAGADIVAPSDMMDGRVAAIREALDADGNANTPILSYASKFASAFYGPFREAADSAPQFGDRRSYQMDGANLREAMREIDLDLEEGADMILMKPAMPYLDVVHAARENFDVPIGAYQVSGEYSMLHAAFEKGWLERDRTMLESLIGIRRAGADFIVTYFAKDAAKLL
jgi:porphobilinogen synthase